MRQTSLVNSYLLASYLLEDEEEGLNLSFPVPFTPRMPLSQSISVLFLCCKKLRNVANHFPISSSSRNLRIQAFAFFSLSTIIQVVGGLYGEGRKHF